MTSKILSATGRLLLNEKNDLRPNISARSLRARTTAILEDRSIELVLSSFLKKLFDNLFLLFSYGHLGPMHHLPSNKTPVQTKTLGQFTNTCVYMQNNHN